MAKPRGLWIAAAGIAERLRTATEVALAVQCYIPCLSHSAEIVVALVVPELAGDADVDHVVVVAVAAAAGERVVEVVDVKEKAGRQLGRNPPDIATLHSAVIRLGVTVYRRTVILCIHNPRIRQCANFSHSRVPRGLSESRGWTGAVV